MRSVSFLKNKRAINAIKVYEGLKDERSSAFSELTQSKKKGRRT